MQSISVFLDLARKMCWFTVKKLWCQQESRGVSRDLYIFVSSLGKVKLYQVSSLQNICDRFLGAETFLPPSPPPPPPSPHQSADPKRSILNRFKVLNMLLKIFKDLITKPFDLLNIIPLTRQKRLLTTC